MATVAHRFARPYGVGSALRVGLWTVVVLGLGVAVALPDEWQLAIDRGRCADVAPLAEASANVHDPSRARFRPELLFLDGGCRLNAARTG